MPSHTAKVKSFFSSEAAPTFPSRKISRASNCSARKESSLFLRTLPVSEQPDHFNAGVFFARSGGWRFMSERLWVREEWWRIQNQSNKSARQIAGKSRCAHQDRRDARQTARVQRTILSC